MRTKNVNSFIHIELVSKLEFSFTFHVVSSLFIAEVILLYLPTLVIILDLTCAIIINQIFGIALLHWLRLSQKGFAIFLCETCQYVAELWFC